jgi:hypothetical protein
MAMAKSTANTAFRDDGGFCPDMGGGQSTASKNASAAPAISDSLAILKATLRASSILAAREATR